MKKQTIFFENRFVYRKSPEKREITLYTIDDSPEATNEAHRITSEVYEGLVGNSFYSERKAKYGIGLDEKDLWTIVEMLYCKDGGKGKYQSILDRKQSKYSEEYGENYMFELDLNQFRSEYHKGDASVKKRLLKDLVIAFLDFKDPPTEELAKKYDDEVKKGSRVEEQKRQLFVLKDNVRRRNERRLKELDRQEADEYEKQTPAERLKDDVLLALEATKQDGVYEYDLEIEGKKVTVKLEKVDGGSNVRVTFENDEIKPWSARYPLDNPLTPGLLFKKLVAYANGTDLGRSEYRAAKPKAPEAERIEVKPHHEFEAGLQIMLDNVLEDIGGTQQQEFTVMGRRIAVLMVKQGENLKMKIHDLDAPARPAYTKDDLPSSGLRIFDLKLAINRYAVVGFEFDESEKRRPQIEKALQSIDQQPAGGGDVISLTFQSAGKSVRVDILKIRDVNDSNLSEKLNVVFYDETGEELDLRSYSLEDNRNAFSNAAVINAILNMHLKQQ